MRQWSDPRKQALQPEEAALLPAMGRYDLGEPALKTVLLSAEKMKTKRISPTEGEETAPADREKNAAGEKRRNRAALRQVMRR